MNRLTSITGTGRLRAAHGGLRVALRQSGAVTIFNAVFILILLTLMLLYATRIGMFEQRISANEMRQKMAFHSAEAGLDHAAEFVRANQLRMFSASTEAVPDGQGNNPPTFLPGWFSATDPRWLPCPSSPGPNHPCGGIPAMGDANSFYYDADGVVNTDGTFDALPLESGLLETMLPAGNIQVTNEYRTTAVLCPRTRESATCLGASGVPDPAEEPEKAFWMAWLLSYGYSDCNDEDGDGEIAPASECKGNAHVTRAAGSVSALSGAPGVPLVSKNSIPTSGNVEVVPNPNGGAEGVPTSIWANAGTGTCPSGLPAYPLNHNGLPGDAIEVNSSFTTCQLHEWYETDVQPEDIKCPWSSRQQCKCEYPGPEAISYHHGGQSVIGIDIVQDASFPCDLFHYYFGVQGYPTNEYEAIKAQATVIDDCEVLTPEHTGFFWFTGDTCTLDDVGSPDNPVLLVSAADSLTTMNGNSDFFGVLYLANVEDPEQDAAFKPGGGGRVYGAVIVDVLFDSAKFGGTFSIIYNESILNQAGGFGGMGSLPGTWRDFGLPDIAWRQEAP